MRDKWNTFKKWFKSEIWQKENIVYFLIAELIFWSPVIFCLIMVMFNSWWWAGVIAVIGFWAGPFTPAVPLQIGLMFALKKIHKKIRLRKSNRKT